MSIKLSVHGFAFALFVVAKANATPFTFSASNPFDQRANDFHAVFTGTGGTLSNPVLLENAPGAEAPTTLTTSFNELDIAWQEKAGNGVEKGESIKFKFESAHAPVEPYSYTWTFNGADVGSVHGLNGHEYAVIFDSGLTWEAAKEQAQARGDGWHLATITSEAEQGLVASILDGESGQYFLGGFQDPTATDVGDGWQWVTGETWSYENWYSGFNSLVGENLTEPNDFNSSNPTERVENHTEDYLSVWGLYDWKWNDTFSTAAFGSETSGYVIERTVPAPGSILLMGIGLVSLIYRVRRNSP
ncbi:MAG: PEP-CTERM sorting domain-containing protein [Gammaproteobacteria bacterium]|nr:PEP-CTERM sorting domain-containing protein [Gammaproteobacteria bacterium]